MPVPVIAAAVAQVGQVISTIIQAVEAVRIGMQRQPGIDDTAAQRLRPR